MKQAVVGESLGGCQVVAVAISSFKAFWRAAAQMHNLNKGLSMIAQSPAKDAFSDPDFFALLGLVHRPLGLSVRYSPNLSCG